MYLFLSGFGRVSAKLQGVVALLKVILIELHEVLDRFEAVVEECFDLLLLLLILIKVASQRHVILELSEGVLRPSLFLSENDSLVH